MSAGQELLLSLCMIVKNEEAVLDACLKSVHEVVDEIVIVDTGSTDSTREIARSYRAEIIDYEWKSDFSQARNTSLEIAKGKWILVLDADEVLTDPAQKNLRDTTLHTGADALSLVIRNQNPEGELQAYSDFYLTRLFRNDDNYRFEGMIHEQIRPSIEKNGGIIEKSDLVIEHHGYGKKTVQGGVSRAKRNLQILEQTLKKTPDDSYLLYQLGVTYKQMGRDTEAIETLKKAELRDTDRILLPETRALLFMKLAQLYLASDHYTNAVDYARKCLSLEPQNIVALYVIGVALLYQHKIKEAGVYLLKARNHPQLHEAEKEQLDQLISFCGGR